MWPERPCDFSKVSRPIRDRAGLQVPPLDPAWAEVEQAASRTTACPAASRADPTQLSTCHSSSSPESP